MNIKLDTKRFIYTKPWYLGKAAKELAYCLNIIQTGVEVEDLIENRKAMKTENNGRLFV